MNGRPATESVPGDDVKKVTEANKPTCVAEIVNAEGRILVTIIAPSSAVTFCRSFHAICDAERWLLRLARAGLSSRDRARLQKQELLTFGVGALGPIRTIDDRQSKRCSLPDFFI